MSVDEKVDFNKRNLVKWMEQLPSAVTTNVQFKDLAIPGSHDSATFDLDPASGKADDFSSELELPDDKIERWFKTQNLDFLGQLRVGVRYFDLRIIKHHKTGEVRFVHGLYSRELVSNYLNGIRHFLDEHQKEVVILDFNHIYNLKKEDHTFLCTEMESIFSGIMLNRKKCEDRELVPSKMTLSEFWELNGRVLILYGNSKSCRSHEHIWPRHEVDILWPYTPNIDSVVQNLQDQYKGLYRKDVMVVWHGILTPHSDDNFADRIKRFKDLHEFVSPATSAVVQWIKSRPKIPLNICCADFVEEHQFVETVVRANYNEQSV